MQRDDATIGNLEGLDDANLVVDGHDRDKSRVGPDCGLEGCEIEKTVRLDGQICDLNALLLEMAARIENALVFLRDTKERQKRDKKRGSEDLMLMKDEG